jgi:hypothetical protein
MKDEKKRYWQNPDWNSLSVRRKYPFKLSEHSDWQDILSTYECLIPNNPNEKKERKS